MATKDWFEAKVKDCKEVKEGSGIFNIELISDNFQNYVIEPGQFIMLEPLSESSCMHRPFSISNITENGLLILVQVAGKNTKLYSKLTIGDTITVSSPRGEPIKINKEAGKYILVAGGIGIAPFIFLARKLLEQEKFVEVYIGARHLSQVVLVESLEKMGCTVRYIAEHEGEKRGLVTDLLKDELHNDNGMSVVVACGPVPMLKAVHDITRGMNECYIIYEEVMACRGIGMCKGCYIATLDAIDTDVKHVCKDGPAFKATKINWTECIRAITTFPLPRSKKKQNPMEVVLAGQDGRELILPSPLMNGSGCLDVEAIEKGQYDAKYLGMLIAKGLTLLSQVGNPAPRVCETPSGMLNSIGLENPGVDVFIRERLPRWLALGKPIAVNIAGKTVEEFIEITEKLVDAGVMILEVNISCPNIKMGGQSFGKYPETAFSAVKAVRENAKDVFIIVKLTPNVSDVVVVAQAVKEAGADALSLINTIQGADVDVYSRKPKLGTILGGLSGPSILPVGLAMVYQVYQAKINLPLIGVGGITDAESAIKYFIFGAQAVQFGTGGFKNPEIATDIFKGIGKYMEKHEVNDVGDLVGSLITN